MNPSRFQRLKELLIRAKSLPEDRQQEYLDDSCGDDHDLRREAESLLCHGVNPDEMMQTGAVLPLRVAEEPSDPGTIGPYRLGEPIGEGGFGLVYRAEQVGPIRRDVALKLIKPGMDSKEIIARFEAERQALAMMDHPGISTILDAGSTEAGRPFFVMELVDGVPITEFCDTHRLSLPERLRIFASVCRAVHHAHQKGVVHRDLKPSNVLVTHQDAEPTPKVIDFGISKALHGPLTDRTLITRPGHSIGTPTYMSPEQIGGDVADIDGRTDVYSLGVLLHELLTGATPLTGDFVRKASYAEVHTAVCEPDLSKPSDRVTGDKRERARVAHNRGLDSRDLPRAIRGDLDWIVMKSLERDRGRRYSTAYELEQDVVRYLSGDPVEARPPSLSRRARGFLKRRRSLVTALLTGLSVVLLALITSMALSARFDRQLREISGRVETVAGIRPEAVLLVAGVLLVLSALVWRTRAKGAGTAVKRRVSQTIPAFVGVSLIGLSLGPAVANYLGIRDGAAAGPPIPGGTYQVTQMSTGRPLTAYDTEHDQAVYTLGRGASRRKSARARWVLTPLDNGSYTLQQLSSNRYMDAYQHSTFAVVARSVLKKQVDQQSWVLTPVGSQAFTIQQLSTGRYLGGLYADSLVSTAPAAESDDYHWLIRPGAPLDDP